jgi:hypothetical protein
MAQWVPDRRGDIHITLLATQHLPFWLVGEIEGDVDLTLTDAQAGCETKLIITQDATGYHDLTVHVFDQTAKAELLPAPGQTTIVTLSIVPWKGGKINMLTTSHWMGT